MAKIIWTNESLTDVKALPRHVQEQLGYQLDCLQHGELPSGSVTIDAKWPILRRILVSFDVEYYLYYHQNLNQLAANQLPINTFTEGGSPVETIIYILYLASSTSGRPLSYHDTIARQKLFEFITIRN